VRLQYTRLCTGTASGQLVCGKNELPTRVNHSLYECPLCSEFIRISTLILCMSSLCMERPLFTEGSLLR
jgi:hypothetical protein